MMPCTKSHFRIDHDLIRKFRPGFMKSGPHPNLITYPDRLKITFPYLVPVFLGYENNIIRKSKQLVIRLQLDVQYFLVKSSSFDISFKSKIDHLKSIKTNFSQI